MLFQFCTSIPWNACSEGLAGPSGLYEATLPASLNNCPDKHHVCRRIKPNWTSLATRKRGPTYTESFRSQGPDLSFNSARIWKEND
jgi:hypothetical protein